MKIYNNEILNDCSWFAEKHRGKYKLSGPHWSTIIRFTPLFDEAARLQQRVDTLEAYIDEFTPDSMQIAQLKAENERLKKRAESAEKALWDIVYYVPGVGERDYSDKLIRIAETAVGIERY